MAGEGQLIERVASGVAWSIAEKVGSALLQAVVSIVVANRIMPMDMGIMAVLTVFISLALLVVDSGFSQALIRKANPSEADFRAVFRFNILSSIALYILLTAISPMVARYYGWTQLADVAPILFLSLPLNALGVIQNTIMIRELRFAQLSTMTFISTLVSGIIAIAMAVAGMGIWALVGQRLSSMATKSALLWIYSDWAPRKANTKGVLREMAPYSLRLMATEIFTSIYNNISQLFIGKIYSGSTLGHFTQAQKLVNMPYSLLLSIQSVTFPALSRIKDESKKFAESYRLVVMSTSMIMFPIAAGLIATAEDFYTLLLKPDWHPAIPYFRIMCIGIFFQPLQQISYNILKVKSDGSIILRLEAIKRTIMAIILIVTIPISVKAVAWGLVISVCICEMMLNTWGALRYVRIGVVRLVRTTLPIAALTLVMYGVVMYVGQQTLEWSVGARLALKILTGVTVYVAGGFLFRLEAFREGWTLVKRFIQKKGI